LAASNKVTALISSSTSDARLAVIIPPALLANQAIICIQILQDEENLSLLPLITSG
jgi:hypothetical protein